MDHFGIGAAIASAVEMYAAVSRQTGRTLSLVESAKDGDRLVFASSAEAQRVGRLCAERGVEVQVVVCSPEYTEKLFEQGTAQGRVIFDHTWVEERYRHILEKEMRHIDYLERELSGYGAAHRETRRQAEELAKWQQWPPRPTQANLPSGS